MYDFDKITERRNTGSIKFDFPERRGKPAGLLPLWVADMDFPSPPCVLEALHERIDHGIFGYSEPDGRYFEAVTGWYRNRFGWEVKAEHVVPSPGVVFALYTAVRAYTRQGGAVMIQQPVYAPFTSCVVMNDRQLVVNRLVKEVRDGAAAYSMDFETFEKQIIENRVKLFILCSPHNPVGRVWKRDELMTIGEICLKHGVIVVSDEIHADFIYAPNKHTVFSDLSKEFAENSVICTAPAKTFNLAGLHNANIVISNEKLREGFITEQRKAGVSQLSADGLTAARAAYEGGAQWLDELISYLRGNIRCIDGFLSRRLPRMRLVEPEGTYLAWIDASGLNMDDDELMRTIERKAGLWLEPGAKFGDGGRGFTRMNFAAPRAVIEEALERLGAAFPGPKPPVA